MLLADGNSGVTWTTSQGSYPVSIVPYPVSIVPVNTGVLRADCVNLERPSPLETNLYNNYFHFSMGIGLTILICLISKAVREWLF